MRETDPNVRVDRSGRAAGSAVAHGKGKKDSRTLIRKNAPRSAGAH